jgi:adenylate cyclase
VLPQVVNFTAFLAVMGVVGYVVGRRVLAPVRRWIDDRREPDALERRATLLVPRRLMTASFVIWLVATTYFTTLNLALGEGGREAARVGFATVLGGVTTSAMAYVLVDWTMRPLFRRAFAAGPVTVRVPGVRRRLVVTWVVSTGIPLVGIAMTWVGRTGAEQEVLRTATALAWIGIVTGLVMTSLVARSVADRIEAVRNALARVQDGDVTVEVAVDEGGEIGSLQAGVNAMVTGLREREELRDLFGRHVGDEVARHVIDRGRVLGGEVRDASALFVDLVASTTLAVERPPQEVVGTLNELFDVVVTAISEEGGWVNKFEGDGALCVFGAPEDLPDHAARALRAARRMRDELGRRGLHVGIGVGSGPVVAGNVGAERRFEYTVIGDPVNVAARLTDLAKGTPGHLLASARAVDAAGDEGSGWEPVGELELRGRAGRTLAFAPAGTGGAGAV